MTARLRERSTIIALVMALALTTVVIVGETRKEHVKPATSYAFDSLYEDRRGESYLNEQVLERQERIERRYTPLESKPARKRTSCDASPPPPSAHRLLCTVSSEVEELYEHAKITRSYRWRAAVLVSPTSGALSVQIDAPSVARPRIAP